MTANVNGKGAAYAEPACAKAGASANACEKEEDLPLVSVVMPAYNAARYIGCAIQSVREQTYEQIELIIVDDASSDNTYAIACTAAQHDKRVRVYALPENVGVARCRNFAIQQARGSYVAFLDCDDCWAPHKTKSQLDAMRENDAVLCCSSYYFEGERRGRRGGRGVVEVPETITYGDMLRKNYIGCSTAMVARDLLGDDPFDGRMTHEDYALWLSLTLRGVKALGVREPLVTYRVRLDGRSGNKLKAARGRWQVLRACTNESLPRCAGAFVRYAFDGVGKYSKLALRKRSSRG